MRKKIYYIHQWFSTGVPRDSVKGAAGFQFSSPLDVFYHLGVPANIDIADQECCKSKKVENHCYMSPFLSRSNFKFSYWKNVEKINRFVKTNSLGIFLNPFYRSKNEEKKKDNDF